MKKIDSIYLYLTNIDDQYMISIGDTNDYLKTPNGQILSSSNIEIIENTIFELQRYDKVEINENNSAIGEPLSNVSFYSLLCTEIDYWNNQREIAEGDINDLLKSDPFTNISPGPEVVDQLHQWRSIISTIEALGFDFHSIQYYINEREEFNKLLTKICKDFNSSSSFHKSVFINLLTIYGSPIASWAFCFHNLTGNAFATAFTQTGDFLFNLNDAVIEEVENIMPENDTKESQNSNFDEEYDKILNLKKREIFEDILKVLDSCRKFIDISNKLPTEVTLEESIKHEYKSSFNTPFPENPKPLLDNDGQTYYQLDKKRFKSLKEVQRFIEGLSLKTIVAFLNTKGGTLVIGVKEKDNIKEIVGIECDKFSSEDAYERHICQQVSNRIGTRFLSEFLSIEFEKIQGKIVCIIKCDQYIPTLTEIPAYLDDVYLYRRTGARSDLIKPGRESAFFVSERKQFNT